MTDKHRDPEYRKNARIIRQRVNRAHQLGDGITCWRCGRYIVPGQAFDIGHLDAAGGSAMGNLAPEHRHRSALCRGNRSAGGTMGAAITNRASRRASGLLPW